MFGSTADYQVSAKNIGNFLFLCKVFYVVYNVKYVRSK